MLWAVGLSAVLVAGMVLHVYVVAPRLKRLRLYGWQSTLDFDRQIGAQQRLLDDGTRAAKDAEREMNIADAAAADAAQRAAQAEADLNNPETRCGANTVALFRDQNYQGDYWCLSRGDNWDGGFPANSLLIPSGVAGRVSVEVFNGQKLKNRSGLLLQSQGRINGKTRSARVNNR
jgi:hypothetical protein